MTLMTAPLWQPTDDQIANSRMTDFMRFASEKTGQAFQTYHELYDWSVTDIEAFWQCIWGFGEFSHSKSYDRVLTGHEMFGAKWFDGAEFNFAENLLRYRDDHPALIYQNESGIRSRLSYAELYQRVASCAAGLKKLGVKTGDRVAGFITNRPEAIIAMLAATSIGAIWSSCSPDFGFKGVFDRFSQIEPKVLFAIDEYLYNGKSFSTVEKVAQLKEHISAITSIITVSDSEGAVHPGIESAISFAELADDSTVELVFVQLPFNHPVYIMYSSGTTGLPKCMVHGAGGTLLQHFKEIALHTDVRREDVITYFTTCGWMMWNWLVSSLAIGATVFLYDGNPMYPHAGILWEAVAKEKITIFGTSPKYLSGCQSAGIHPGRENDLRSLKAVLSTGSPLSAENFNFVYQDIKADVRLSSISGGTDIVSCFMLGNPNLPVYSGEIQCRGLGMKVEVYNDDEKPVHDEVGELVCTAPFVSMPVSFWNDPEGKKYRDAYFEHFPGVWRHGDFIKITEHGGIIVYGRSDATLNPGGVRIGTAEIYEPVEAMEEIVDSIVVAQSQNGDSRIVLFVVLAEGCSLTEEMKQKIRAVIRQQASPRHVPAVILPVSEIPVTINGKKVELAVTKVIHGQPIRNRDALANPESLKEYEGLRERLAS
ncbi:MAG: acetoacetate--CoA ligase [Candidatus Zixiibacteriota bacterium]